MRNGLLLVGVLWGCEKTGDGAAPAVLDGTLTGRACDEETHRWAEGVSAYVNVLDDAGAVVGTLTTSSGPDGRWSLDVPGDAVYTVYEQRGADIRRFDPVLVNAGASVSVAPSGQLCFEVRPLSIAVVDGDYDDVEGQLAQLGLEATRVDGRDADETLAFLGDAAAMAGFDVIFVEGGIAEDGVLTEVVEPVTAYVDAGGRLFVGDWSYDLVELAWPDRIDFVGDDRIHDGAQLGEYDRVDAVLSDRAVEAFVGAERTEVLYDDPLWPPMNSVNPAASLHVTGTVHYREGQSTYTLASVPLQVSFGSGLGRVTFTTFAWEDNDTEDMDTLLELLLYEP
jgi:hypothetical protein